MSHWAYIPTNLTDMLKNSSLGDIDDNEFDLNDNSGWDSDNHDKDFVWNVNSEDEFDDWISLMFQISILWLKTKNKNLLIDFFYFPLSSKSGRRWYFMVISDLENLVKR